MNLLFKTHWEVHGSLPPKDGQKWRGNATLHVMTNSARRAIELAEEKYDGIQIDSVHKRGEVDIVDEQANG